MRSGRRFVSARGLLSPILVSINEEFEDFIRRVHLNFAETGNLHALDRILAQIQHIVPEHDKVLNVFVVDFEEADSDCVLTIYLMSFHLFEQILHGVKHDARILVIADHRISFAGACVAVAKYGRVEAIKSTLAQKLCCIFEYFLLRCSIVKCVVEGVLLFFSSVTAEDLFFVQDVRRVHQDDDVAIENLYDANLAAILLLSPHGPKADCHQDL